MPVLPKGSGSLIYENGRDDRIRTCGLIVPNDARYQTVPHPDMDSIVMGFAFFVKPYPQGGRTLRIAPHGLPLCGLRQHAAL